MKGVVQGTHTEANTPTFLLSQCVPEGITILWSSVRVSDESLGTMAAKFVA